MHGIQGCQPSQQPYIVLAASFGTELPACPLTMANTSGVVNGSSGSRLSPALSPCCDVQVPYSAFAWCSLTAANILPGCQSFSNCSTGGRGTSSRGALPCLYRSPGGWHQPWASAGGSTGAGGRVDQPNERCCACLQVMLCTAACMRVLPSV